jgi:hypothetical protein
MSSYYHPSPQGGGFVPMPPGTQRQPPSESDPDASDRVIPSPMSAHGGWGNHQYYPPPGAHVGHGGHGGHGGHPWGAGYGPPMGPPPGHPAAAAYGTPHMGVMPWMSAMGGGPPPLVPAGTPGPANEGLPRMDRPRHMRSNSERHARFAREPPQQEHMHGGMPGYMMTPGNTFGMMGMPPHGTPWQQGGMIPGYSPMIHPAMMGQWGTTPQWGPENLEEPASLVAQRHGHSAHRDEGNFIDKWAPGKDCVFHYPPLLTSD